MNANRDTSTVESPDNQPTGQPSIGVGDLLDAVASEARRYIITSLRGGDTTTDDLARELAAFERDEPTTVPDEEDVRLQRAALRHKHLPVLNCAGITRTYPALETPLCQSSARQIDQGPNFQYAVDVIDRAGDVLYDETPRGLFASIRQLFGGGR